MSRRSFRLLDGPNELCRRNKHDEYANDGDLLAREETTRLFHSRFILTLLFELTAPYFIATKPEVFQRHGLGHYTSSHGLEDLVTVIAGWASIVEALLTNTQRRAMVYNLRCPGIRRSFRQTPAVKSRVPWGTKKL